MPLKTDCGTCNGKMGLDRELDSLIPEEDDGKSGGEQETNAKRDIY